MRSPIRWFGGKGNVVAKLLPLVPPHRTYVEPYGGGASLLFAKNPSPVEVYNDLNQAVVDFFRVLRDPELFARFYHLAALTPYSRYEWNYCKSTWRDVDDPVERAYRWFVMQRQGFSGRGGHGWGYAVGHSRRGLPGTVSNWLSTLSNLPECAERMMRVQIECIDGVDCIAKYDTKQTFFYIDPPYPQATRSGGGYDHEMDDDDHHRLVDKLLCIEGLALVSTYPNPIYERLRESGWNVREWQTACYAAGRTRGTGMQGAGSATKMQPRTEVVYYNYEPDNAPRDGGLFGDQEDA